MLSAEVETSHAGNPFLVVTLSWKNRSGETSAFSSEIETEATQGGVVIGDYAADLIPKTVPFGTLSAIHDTVASTTPASSLPPNAAIPVAASRRCGGAAAPAPHTRSHTPETASPGTPVPSDTAHHPNRRAPIQRHNPGWGTAVREN